jgi:hypothetical protein
MTFHPKSFVVVGSLILLLTLTTANVRGAGRSVSLALEQRMTLRVGETAVLRLPADEWYSPRFAGQLGQGSPGGRLVLVRRSRRVLVYRAVRAGQDVIVVPPKAVKESALAARLFTTSLTLLHVNDLAIERTPMSGAVC